MGLRQYGGVIRLTGFDGFDDLCDAVAGVFEFPVECLVVMVTMILQALEQVLWEVDRGYDSICRVDFAPGFDRFARNCLRLCRLQRSGGRTSANRSLRPDDRTLYLCSKQQPAFGNQLYS